jgi:hypothetical protein
VIEDCNSIEPENCAEHGEEAFATNEQIMAYGKALADDNKIFQKALYDQATKPKHDPYEFLYADRPEGFSTYIGPVFDKEKLFQLLVKSCCPVVCKGHRVNVDNPDEPGYDPFSSDWHELCENTAHRAMRELGYE